jgi:opacity protein-like surface antigen
MKAGLRTCALAAIAAAAAMAALAVPAQGGQGGGDVAKAGCGLSVSEQRNLGISGTYVTSVKAKGVKCGKAKKLVSKFHECRKQNGGRDGNCGGFSGWNCGQKILDSSPAQYNAKAKCKKGGRKFKNTYTQST